MTWFIGAHTIDNGGIHMAALRAASAGMTAMQLFTAIPKFYNEKTSIRPERVGRFRAALAQTEIRPEHVLVHAGYVLGVATPDEVKWKRAAAGLTRELERSTTLGAGGVCFHPGSAGGDDRETAGKRVAAAITLALETVPGATRLLVENTAGAGSTMGRTAAEVGAILSHVPAALRSRTGYGLDTCHLYSSGYDIAESPAALRAILDEFQGATGERPAFFHLNDSEGALGSNRDRHVLLGEGAIGENAFRWLLEDERSHEVPLILETPQQHYEIAPDDASADPYDMRMMALLKGFAAGD